MKHGYYLYTDNLKSSSLTSKILMQIKAFNRELSIEECALRTVKKPLLLRLTNVFPFCSYSRDYDGAIEHILNPDFIYIRMISPDMEYLSFLASIKSRFPDCKIIVEIPTYPYKKEWCSSLYGSCMYLKDFLYRKKYNRYIDRFVTFSSDDYINGVKTIQTMNGVDVESVTPVCIDRDYDPNCITLIAVAFLMRHHGYERVIEGIKDYYNRPRERKVYIIIIGEGTEKKKYTKLVKKYKLLNYISLPGSMYGDDLEKMYRNVDAGLAGFGFYKDGVEQVGTLKTREYLAKGLPVVLGTDDKLFNEEDSRYGLVFPNDDSPINIEEVLSFLDQLYSDRSKREVSESIRQFARGTVDNSVTLAPIIEYIERC